MRDVLHDIKLLRDSGIGLSAVTESAVKAYREVYTGLVNEFFILCEEERFYRSQQAEQKTIHKPDNERYGS